MFFQNGQMREKVEMLEDHAYVLPEFVYIRMGRVDKFPLEPDFPGGGLFKQVQAAQESALSGAGGAYDEHHLPWLICVVTSHRMDGIELLHQMADFEHGHGRMLGRLIHCFSVSFPVCPAAS